MKKLFMISFAILIVANAINAQCINNPSIQQGDVNPAPLPYGEGGTLSFSYTENLLAYSEYANDPVELVVCLLNIAPVEEVNSIGGSYYNHFDWAYDEITNCFKGTQNQPIAAGSGGTITVDFVQVTPVLCPINQMGFSANVQPAACMNGVNETTDDSESVYTCSLPTEPCTAEAPQITIE